MLQNTIQTRREVARAMLTSPKGRFMSVTFRKKDGTIRTLNIQPEAVKTHLAENPSASGLKAAETRRKNHPNLIPVWDVQARAIKSINLDTVMAIKVDGNVFQVEAVS